MSVRFTNVTQKSLKSMCKTMDKVHTIGYTTEKRILNWIIIWFAAGGDKNAGY